MGNAALGESAGVGGVGSKTRRQIQMISRKGQKNLGKRGEFSTDASVAAAPHNFLRGLKRGREIPSRCIAGKSYL